jgi:hypothetical protein
VHMGRVLDVAAFARYLFPAPSAGWFDSASARALAEDIVRYAEHIRLLPLPLALASTASYSRNPAGH